MQSDPRHLSLRHLLDYFDERLSASERRRVEDHLGTSCQRCRELLLEVGRMVEFMRTDRADEVPRSLHERALGQFVPPAETRAPEATLWRLATLVFDSLRDPIPAAVRRAVGDSRWVRFSLDGHPLEMEAELEPGEAWTLRGRIGLPDAALYHVEVEVANETLGTWPDAEGRFALEQVPAGEVDLRLRGPAQGFRLPPISL